MITQAELRGWILRRVTEARESAGYNKREMAAHMKMAPSTWTEYEQGKYALDLYQLIRVADVTGHKLSFFIPDAAVPDLRGALEHAYPILDADGLDEVLRFAAWLSIKRASREERKHHPDAESSAGTSGSSETPEGQRPSS